MKTDPDNQTYPIEINGVTFPCESGDGTEYPYGTTKPCLPFKPYRFERILDNGGAYLVDAKGIVWTLEGEYGLTRFCLRSCLVYIMYNDPEFKDMKPSEIFAIIGVDDEREKWYDEEFEYMKRKKAKDSNV